MGENMKRILTVTLIALVHLGCNAAEMGSKELAAQEGVPNVEPGQPANQRVVTEFATSIGAEELPAGGWLLKSATVRNNQENDKIILIQQITHEKEQTRIASRLSFGNKFLHNVDPQFLTLLKQREDHLMLNMINFLRKKDPVLVEEFMNMQNIYTTQFIQEKKEAKKDERG